MGAIMFGPMYINPGDPLTFVVLVALVGVVLAGLYFALREVIADAIALADKRERERRELDQRERGRRL